MKALLAFLSMIPDIIKIVRAVEDAIPQKSQGAKKLTLVLNTVDAAVKATPPIADALAGHDIPGTVTSIVNATVATMNAAKGQ